MTVSGWCRSPLGARPKCDQCKAPGCSHGCHESRSTEGLPVSAHGRIGAQLNGPERGVCTSGRGLIDAVEERQL